MLPSQSCPLAKVNAHPCASKFRNLFVQAKDRTWAYCALALSVSGTSSRSRLCPDGPRVHLSGPACMPSCIRPEVRLPLQRVLCSDYCKKSRLLYLAQVVFSQFVLHSSKIPLMLTTSYTFAQPAVQTARWI